MIISVEVAGTLAITQQMSNLNQLGKMTDSLIIFRVGCFLLPGTRSGDNNQHNPFRAGQVIIIMNIIIL